VLSARDVLAVIDKESWSCAPAAQAAGAHEHAD
jgi:hypothetical protein